MLEEYLANPKEVEWSDRNRWKVPNVNKEVHVEEKLRYFYPQTWRIIIDQGLGWLMGGTRGFR